MDEFDDMIKKSKSVYTPSTHFTEETMQKINLVEKVKAKGWKVWAPTIVAVSALATFAFLAVPSWINGTTPASTPTTTTTPSSTSSTSTPSGDTSDQSLNNDLQNIQSSQTQENNDQSGATSSLNDSSQQVTVPTD